MVQSFANALALSETFANKCTIPIFQGGALQDVLLIPGLQTRLGQMQLRQLGSSTALSATRHQQAQEPCHSVATNSCVLLLLK